MQNDVEMGLHIFNITFISTLTVYILSGVPSLHLFTFLMFFFLIFFQNYFTHISQKHYCQLLDIALHHHSDQNLKQFLFPMNLDHNHLCVVLHIIKQHSVNSNAT